MIKEGKQVLGNVNRQVGKGVQLCLADKEWVDQHRRRPVKE